jgi:hypothetical protein
MAEFIEFHTVLDAEPSVRGYGFKGLVLWVIHKEPPYCIVRRWDESQKKWDRRTATLGLRDVTLMKLSARFLEVVFGDTDYPLPECPDNQTDEA